MRKKMAGLPSKYSPHGLILLLLHPALVRGVASDTDVGCVGDLCYKFFEDAHSWDVANHTCRSFSSADVRYALASVPDQNSLDLLRRYAAKNRVESTWLGGHETIFNTWTWLNGGFNYVDTVREYYIGGPKPFCATINSGLGSFEVGGSVCHEEKRYFCTREPVYSSRYFVDVVADNKKSYISKPDDELTWFEARKVCLSKGMDLAIIPGELTKVAFNFFRTEQKNHKEFWIGLRKSKWSWDGTGGRLDFSNFAGKQPDMDTQKCLSFHDGKFYDERCNEAKKFFCEYCNVTAKPTTMNPNIVKDPATSSKTEERDTTPFIIGGVAAGVMLISVGIIILVCLIARRPKTRKEVDEEEREGAGINLHELNHHSVRSYNNHGFHDTGRRSQHSVSTAAHGWEPQYRVESAPRSRMESAPRSRMESAPRSRGESAPRSKMDSAPRSKMDSAPRSRMDSASRSRMDSASRSRMHSAPRSRMESTPPPRYNRRGEHTHNSYRKGNTATHNTHKQHSHRPAQHSGTHRQPRDEVYFTSSSTINDYFANYPPSDEKSGHSFDSVERGAKHTGKSHRSGKPAIDDQEILQARNLLRNGRK